MVFRRVYGSEIDEVSVEEIDEDFKRELAGLQGQLSVYRGAVAEHRVRYLLLVASLRGANLADVVRDPTSSGATPIGPFAVIRKARFYVDQEKSVEIDLHAVHGDGGGTDLMIEVKNWAKEPPLDVVHRFVGVKEALEGQLKRKTVFLFYSESGLGKEAQKLLHQAGILVLDPEKLAGFEASGGL
jgi:hypothetical protein